MEVDGRSRGRPRKTWRHVIEDDLKIHDLCVERESSWCEPANPGDPGKPIAMYAPMGYGHKTDMCVCVCEMASALPVHSLPL
jgi:hypothetical protein